MNLKAEDNKALKLILSKKEFTSYLQIKTLGTRTNHSINSKALLNWQTKLDYYNCTYINSMLEGKKQVWTGRKSMKFEAL